MIVRPRIGDVVRVCRGPHCDAGRVGIIRDATHFPASDERSWRWSISVEFDDGTTNLFTEDVLEENFSA